VIPAFPGESRRAAQPDQRRKDHEISKPQNKNCNSRSIDGLPERGRLGQAAANHQQRDSRFPNCRAPIGEFQRHGKDAKGTPVTGAADVTFSLYTFQEGGSPLWVETQKLQLDEQGHYTVLLGATQPEGLPLDLFTSGQAQWLGVQPELPGAPEQLRVLLVGMPYALKAADADTLGGLPASAFALAAAAGSSSSSSAAAPSATQTQLSDAPETSVPLSSTITGSGTANTLAMFTAGSTIGNSLITQSGGAAVIAEALEVPALGTATSSSGFNSNPFDSLASAYNNSTKAAVEQHFRWQAEPVSNNTSSPSGKFNLLFASGTGTPAETGLSISSKGLFTFASGQTFPGVGTVTSITAGSGLSGGTITKSGTISIPSTGVTNSMLQNSQLTVTAGTGLSGGGSVSLGGSTTLNMASASCPAGQAAMALPLSCSPFATLGANSFNGSLTVTGNVNATGSVSAASASFSGNVSTGPLTASNSNNPSENAVYGYSSGTGAAAVVGYSTASSGVVGDSAYDSPFQAGVYGAEYGTTQETFGVEGYTASPAGAGVYGVNVSASSSSIGNYAGVWGDTGVTADYGVLGTADDGFGVYAVNNSPTGYPALSVVTDATSCTFGICEVFETYGKGFGGGSCTIDVSGNLNCSGSIAIPAEANGRKTALYSVGAAESWFEDFGSGRLAAGAATVALDPAFAATVNTGVDYHVFLTPKGDCNGVYVTNETPAGFEVHELGGGQSSVAFDYRIVAHRKGYENIRLADLTDQFNNVSRHARMKHVVHGKVPIPKPHQPEAAPFVHPAVQSAPKAG
jgi:hypothetical protein